MSGYRLVTRQFSPAEAAEISGVSVTLQRDWRRRELLPPNTTGRWATFELGDIITMAVMKSFSDAGISIQKTKYLVGLALMPTYEALHRMPALYSFDDDVDEAGRDISLWAPGFTDGPRDIGRYLVAPEDKNNNDMNVFRTASLDRIPVLLDACGAVHCTVLDCRAMATRIAQAAKGPLFRVEMSDPSE